MPDMVRSVSGGTCQRRDRVFLDEGLGPELAQVVAALSGAGLFILADYGSHLVGELGALKPAGDAASASTAARALRVGALLRSMPPTREAGGSSSNPSAMKPTRRSPRRYRTGR